MSIHRIIKIAGIFPVNSAKGDITQVHSACAISGQHFVWQFFSLSDGLIGKFMRKIELPDSQLDFQLSVVLNYQLPINQNADLGIIFIRIMLDTSNYFFIRISLKRLLIIQKGYRKIAKPGVKFMEMTFYLSFFIRFTSFDFTNNF